MSEYTEKELVEIACLKAENARMREALEGTVAFISVIFGHGPDAVIPETVDTPIGVPVKVGDIVRKARAALTTPAAEKDKTC